MNVARAELVLIKLGSICYYYTGQIYMDEQQIKVEKNCKVKAELGGVISNQCISHQKIQHSFLLRLDQRSRIPTSHWWYRNGTFVVRAKTLVGPIVCLDSEATLIMFLNHLNGSKTEWKCQYLKLIWAKCVSYLPLEWHVTWSGNLSLPKFQYTLKFKEVRSQY